MKYEIVISKEFVIKIQSTKRENLLIVVNQSGKMYYASILGPNVEVLLQTEDIFNSKDIAKSIMNQFIDTIISDNVSTEFATSICYALNVK